MTESNRFSTTDQRHMSRALELAELGRGYVEPNPMVGCVIAQGEQPLGEGYHRRFGGDHAEVEALCATNTDVRGATMYVTLEPCCHHGKTPPCSEAVVRSGVSRVVIAQSDPFPQVSGGGIQQLRDAGIQVDVGLMASQAIRLNCAYLTRVQWKRPWVIAKWAMTLDGKMATCSGDSRWISGEASRARVHQLRGCMDAIVVGRATAEADDPQLTVRPPGPRTPTRVVFDSQAQLSSQSVLVQTAREISVLAIASESSLAENRQRLRQAGVEVWTLKPSDRGEMLRQALREMGHRQMTNVLVEGGGQLLGSLFDLNLIDEVHAFIASKLVGGQDAVVPLAGMGRATMDQAMALDRPLIEQCDGDIYIHGPTETSMDRLFACFAENE